ncbi:MAG: TadE/TadG family type IV pilus assembly protein, partial [Planctomycetota bacterium]
LAILALVEFGRAMMVGQLVTNAAREGARTGILYGSTDAEVRTHVTEFLENAGDIDPAAVDLTVTVTAGPDRRGSSPTNLGDTESGDRVTVTVVVPWDQAGWGTLRWLGGKSFRGEATMRHE